MARYVFSEILETTSSTHAMPARPHAREGRPSPNNSPAKIVGASLAGWPRGPRTRSNTQTCSTPRRPRGSNSRPPRIPASNRLLSEIQRPGNNPLCP
eukprot:11193466-Lingulodinium_polyedra.AAC.1